MTPKEKQRILRKEYSRERSRIVKRIANLRERGYVFDDSVVPPKIKELGRNILKKDIEKLSKITPEKLIKKSEGYIDVDTGEVLSGKLGIEIEKTQRKLTNLTNLAKANARKTELEYKQRFGHERFDVEKERELARQLYETNQKLLDEGKIEESKQFIANLSYEDYQLLMRGMGDAAKSRDWARKFRDLNEDREKEILKKEGKKNVTQGNLPIRRKNEKPVLQNEGSEFGQENGEEGYEGSYSEPREESGISETSNSKKDNERRKVKPHKISRSQQKKIDKAAQQWRDDYERQKHIRKTEREFARDSVSLLAGIQERLKHYIGWGDSSDIFASRHSNQLVACRRILNTLDGAIKINGLNDVIARIVKNADRIDELIATLTDGYDDDGIISDNVSAELATIFHGGALSMDEANYWGEDADNFVSSDEADDFSIWEGDWDE